MGGLRAGLVVLVRFPFSDLSTSKLRPALILASAGGTDWVLCQITSNPYSDPPPCPSPQRPLQKGASPERVSFGRASCSPRASQSWCAARERSPHRLIVQSWRASSAF